MYQPELETLSREKLRALQEERLSNIVAYVYERVPFYRRLLDEAGVDPKGVRTLEDLPKLPFTKKDHLRENYPFGLFAVPRERLARIHASSGTTGKPTVVGYTKNDLQVFAEVVARSLAAAGAKPGMMLHNAYGYGLFTGGLGLHGGAEALGMTVVPVSSGMTERQLMLIQDFRPEVISCTPSYAQTLAEEFRKRGVSPEALSLEYAVLGAEPWTEAIRKQVDEGLGVRSTNIYGLSEIIGPGVANECVEERQGSHIWEDHFLPEVVDPDSGEPLPEGQVGVLVFTTLTKEAMPLLRYWTGDLTFLTYEACSCGRTHVRMGPILGRTDDMLIIRGVNVYPTQVEAVLSGIPEVEPYYQIVVRREGTLDEAELKVEVSEAFFQEIGRKALSDEVIEADHRLHALREKVAHKIKDSIGVSMKVTLLAPGEAPRSEGGKLRRVLDLRKK
ncbi:phenylacetate--CoA ligase family protein [Thermus scotoductus]|uniref:Phenylacetate-coenzyme A ligase n=1 Tax=Thermus scotoductus TaxID=37636 RepID=A0A430RFP4_THESC|nr:phenylacetate--CoA ligase [Thermus scotoductus]RTG92142.1 phenylacetate--CoA ligase [Thermus scotoductus]RTG98578.1 phenylacetate--CoA ligase [Thermus scotoductus]RTH06517.1 phenylacetate--CoA ligase [Thermus scotoductus]RTH08755.1 phenylacetate--CoA ligase [Thermus scotoductus]RTH11824.1 phenylacetate--CoA ligase [Thermus scotoductus]